MEVKSDLEGNYYYYYNIIVIVVVTQITKRRILTNIEAEVRSETIPTKGEATYLCMTLGAMVVY